MKPMARSIGPRVRTGTAAFAVALVSSAILAFSCSDPVRDDAIDALGNETQNIPEGEHHRAGQACVVCHSEEGTASDSPFTIAGTIFAQPARQVGVDGAEIRMTDSDGTTHIAKSNCVGNFFVKPDEWQPRFPILIEVAKGSVRRRMKSPIGREPSCSGCHSFELVPKDPLSDVGHIYLFSGDEPGSPEGSPDCPVDPRRPGTP